MSDNPHVDHLLDDYLDGSLSISERSKVSRHIEGCPRCAEELERSGRLLTTARELPRAIDPPDELWSEIERRITPTPIREPRGRRLDWRWAMAGAAAAAAMIILFVTGAPVAWRDRESATSNDGRSFAPRHVTSLIHALDMECMGAGEQLLAMNASDTLGPETVDAVRRGVTLLDTAIADTRSALDEYPDDPELLKQLVSRYEQKLSLLRRTAQRAGET